MISDRLHPDDRRLRRPRRLRALCGQPTPGGPCCFTSAHPGTHLPLPGPVPAVRPVPCPVHDPATVASALLVDFDA